MKTSGQLARPGRRGGRRGRKHPLAKTTLLTTDRRSLITDPPTDGSALVEACPPWRVATMADNRQLITDSPKDESAGVDNRAASAAFTLPKPRGPFAFTLPQLREHLAFTLVELLIVTGIIAMLIALLAPAFTSVKSGGDVTSALSAVSGTLEQARTYAMANNTYVWVGFYEEASSNPGTAGRGRIIMSVIASKDGTQIFDPSSSPSSTNKLDGTKVVQLGKLIKIENMHLGDVANPNLTNNTLWDQRPGVTSTGPPVMVCRIGDTNPTVGGQPSTTLFPFQYPVGSPLPTAQYTFTKTVQFNPRGESNLNSTYSTVAWIEIGVQPAHGDSPDLSMAKNAAVQVAGFTGDVKIYQR